MTDQRKSHALQRLSNLADACPVVLIDTREQAPLRFDREAHGVLSAVATIRTGDYSVAGCEDLIRIERKSLPDLAACCCAGSKTAEGERERFERELTDLAQFRLRWLLIVGSWQDLRAGNYGSRINPASVEASLAAWNAARVPVKQVDTPAQASDWLARIAWGCWQEHVAHRANRALRAWEQWTPSENG